MNKLFLLILFFFVVAGQAQTKFVASKNSNKYHYTSCRWAQRISPDNLVTFKSADEAAKAGYVPCKVCKPPASDKAATTGNNDQVQQSKKTSGGRKQCIAITKKGTRCKRMAMPGSDYCWQHQR